MATTGVPGATMCPSGRSTLTLPPEGRSIVASCEAAYFPALRAATLPVSTKRFSGTPA